MTSERFNSGDWAILEARVAASGEYPSRPTGITYGGRDVLIAVDGEKRRHLLIPMTRQGDIIEDRECEGVQVVAHNLLEAGQLKSYVDIVCRKPHLDEVFSVLADEILEQILVSDERADGIAHRILSKWRDLLARMAGGRLGREALIGLFGELHYLRQLVAFSANALDCWKGPDSGRHDFERKGIALEVKTTVSRTGRRAEIHGAWQLAPPPGGVLLLAFLRIENVSDSGESIPDLIEAVLKAGVQTDRLVSKLDAIHYKLADSEFYRKERFRILEERLYNVQPGFPRIVDGSFVDGVMPSGVISISYVIELAGEPPDAADLAQREQWFSILAADT